MSPVQTVTYVSGLDIEIIGDPDRIRTCDPQIRNLMLYPAELRGRWIRYRVDATESLFGSITMISGCWRALR